MSKSRYNRRRTSIREQKSYKRVQRSWRNKQKSLLATKADRGGYSKAYNNALVFLINLVPWMLVYFINIIFNLNYSKETSVEILNKTHAYKISPHEFKIKECDLCFILQPPADYTDPNPKCIYFLESQAAMKGDEGKRIGEYIMYDLIPRMTKSEDHITWSLPPYRSCFICLHKSAKSPDLIRIGIPCYERNSGTNIISFHDTILYIVKNNSLPCLFDSENYIGLLYYFFRYDKILSSNKPLSIKSKSNILNDYRSILQWLKNQFSQDKLDLDEMNIFLDAQKAVNYKLFSKHLNMIKEMEKSMDDFILTKEQAILFNAVQKARIKGKAEGKAEGIAEGIAEGVAEGVAKTRINLLRDHMDLGIPLMAKLLPLSKKDLERLISIIRNSPNLSDKQIWDLVKGEKWASSLTK